MLILLSPAKNLNFDPAPSAPTATKPRLKADVAELATTAKSLTKAKIKGLMNISDNLAELNYERFQSFVTSGRIPNEKQAALAFNGDVYLGLDAASFDADDFLFAQDHLRILSGLYGLLRPLDGIQPYRLEMGSKLNNSRGEDLYDFWGDKIAKAINKDAKGLNNPVLVNLASNEYFGAVDKSTLKFPVITPVFKEEKDGKLRQLQFFAKRARGLMARWAIQNRIEDVEALKDFSVDGYKIQPEESSDDLWLFTRPQPPKKS